MDGLSFFTHSPAMAVQLVLPWATLSNAAGDVGVSLPTLPLCADISACCLFQLLYKF